MGRGTFLFVIAVLTLCYAVFAATIDGTVYTSDLAVAKYSLLSINTTPAQRVLSEDGMYNITVPRGSYMMRAVYYRDNLKYEDTLNVTVVDNGRYTYDFIVFHLEGNQTQILVTPEDLSFGAETHTTSDMFDIGWWPAVLLLAVLVAVALSLSKKEWWNPGKKKQDNSSREEEKNNGQNKTDSLSDDLAGVLAAIKTKGGRTTQRELRKHIPVSEAKLSMMLTELEHSGKIKKIKKGRGNLIVLK